MIFKVLRFAEFFFDFFVAFLALFGTNVYLCPVFSSSS